MIIFNIMKKILFIGDIHGHDTWKKIVHDALPKFYPIVFLGDYVDSFSVKPVLILHNLKEIINYKKKYPDRITLLLGNHDYAYIDDHNRVSGFNWQMWQDYKQMFQENYDLFQVAWGYTNWETKKYTLATHAGLTLTYYNNYIKTLIQDPESILNKLSDGKADQLQLHEILNFMRNEDTLWKVGKRRGGMGTPGPLWADYVELLDDPYTGINQVFGHTASGSISVDQFGDDLIAKIDHTGVNGTAHILLNL